MAIIAFCPNCGLKYQLSDALAGKKAQCKDCGEVFAISSKPSPISTPSKPPPSRREPAPLDSFDDGRRAAAQGPRRGADGVTAHLPPLAGSLGPLVGVSLGRR